MEVAQQLAAAPGSRHDVADARQRLRGERDWRLKIVQPYLLR